MKLVPRLLSLIKHKAPKNQYYLELGAYFLKKGAGYKVGDPYKHKTFSKKEKTYYIANLFYDFAHNRVNHRLTLKRPKK